jgi:hypothetical protein
MPQYQGVWTLEQQAQAQSNQQWVTDPNFKNTTLLLQADGVGSGSQNNTFLDGSTNNFFITRNGNTTQGSFSPFSQAPGYWGTKFARSATAGDNTRMLVASNAGLGLQSNNFCIEVWAYFATSYTTDGPFCANLPLAGFVADTFWFGPHSINSGKVTVYIYNYSSSTYFLTETTAPPINEWVHYALVRSGNTFTIYRNGVSTATGTFAGSVTGATSPLYIARSGDSSAANSSFDGFMSNLRVVNGSSVYTSSFTPQTTPLTPITNTGLLTLQSNRWVDNSTNAAAITVDTGTPSVQAFGPFAPALQWTPDVVGGSGYFDGTGDYLQTGSNIAAIGTGDFSLEVWCYPTASTSFRYILAIGSDSNFATGLYTGGYAPYLYAGAFILTSSVSTVPNAWNFVQFIRSSGTLTVYVNGVSGGSVAWTGNIAAGIGRIGANDTPNYYYIGYQSSLRLSTVARSAVIPSAPLTAITNTSLLLNYTNAGIYDGAMKNNLETVGNAQVSTSVVKYGSGSMYFDGTGDYLVSNSGTDLYAFGAGNFTIECWVYFNVVGSQVFYDGRPSGTQTTQPAIYMSGSGVLFYYANGANQITGATLTSGQWYHVAVCRANSQTRMFLNGVQTGSTYSDTTVYTNTAGRPIIGVDGFTVGTNPLNGYIDDLRVTKGVARYIANFTPPLVALPRQ